MRKIVFFLAASLFVSSMVPADLVLAKEPTTSKKKIAQILWSKGLKSGGSKKRYFPEGASPILHEGRLLVGTHSGIFYSLDPARKGRTVWQFPSGGPIASQAVADREKVYFGNNKGIVYALDLATGKMAWDATVGAEVLAPPTLSGDTLYVVTTSREVYALETYSGGEKWGTAVKGFEKKITMRGNSPVVVGGERLFVGFADGVVVALSRSDGHIVWQEDLSQEDVFAEDVDASLVIDGASLYAVGYFGSLVKMERDSGHVVWTKDVASGTEMASDSDTLYLTSVKGTVVAFDKKTGNRRWETPLSSGITSPPLLVGSYLVVGTELNRAYVIGRDNGALLQKVSVSSGAVTEGVTDDSRLYLLSSSAQIYALTIK